MSQGLHLELDKKSLTNSSFAQGELTLDKAKSFTVFIKEKKDLEKRILDLEKILAATPKNPTAVKEMADSKTEIAKFATVNWAWNTVYGMKTKTGSHNEFVEKGISNIGKKFDFPEVLEGGGYCYVEAFFEGEMATGNLSNGLLIKATGKPTVIRIEWTDMQYNPVNDTKVAFGSHLLLHIYTQGLYGQEILVGLKDVNGLNKDLNIANSEFFEREVKTYPLQGFEEGKNGISSLLVKDESAKQAINKIQKAVVEVGVDPVWQFGQIMDIKGSFGDELQIETNIIYKTTGKKIDVLDSESLKPVLNVSKNNGKPLNYTSEVTNMPVVVGEIDTTAKTPKNPINFTFGIFLDGTLNNMYNTEIRQAFENKTGKDAKSQKDVKPYNLPNKIFNNQEKYRFSADSSYENDLSNPAILFKNYKDKETDKIFKVYVEGIGSNTAPDEFGNLNTEDYKNDDIPGKALGQFSSGIIMRVRKAIMEMMKKLKTTNSATEVIKSITIDVFGFSRGAAAARHFVHVVTHGPYVAKMGLMYPVEDLQTNYLPLSYSGKLMPKFGPLGMMLTDAGLMDDATEVNVRFVGIYDTVPHHGLVQGNDADDLGLNNVNRADYVVHMVAGDEHRANFSLVEISTVHKTPPYTGQKGGVELIFPGVHCDVGGSYEEGKPDNPQRIDADDTKEALIPLKKELEKQGWFKDAELTIIKDSLFKLSSGFHRYRLNGYRDRISNQYSFIPLHHMAEFCELKNVPINKDNIVDRSNKFTENWIKNNVSYLENLKNKLDDYCFNNGKAITFEHDPKIITQLRNNYLHWNSSYGQEGIDVVVQTNYPNKEHNKRKREIR